MTRKGHNITKLFVLYCHCNPHFHIQIPYFFTCRMVSGAGENWFHTMYNGSRYELSTSWTKQVHYRITCTTVYHALPCTLHLALCIIVYPSHVALPSSLIPSHRIVSHRIVSYRICVCARFHGRACCLYTTRLSQARKRSI